MYIPIDSIDSIDSIYSIQNLIGGFGDMNPVYFSSV